MTGNIINQEYIPNGASADNNGNVLATDSTGAVYCVGKITMQGNQRIYNKFTSPQFVRQGNQQQQTYPQPMAGYPANPQPITGYPANPQPMTGYPVANRNNNQNDINTPKSNDSSAYSYAKKKNKSSPIHSNTEYPVINESSLIVPHNNDTITISEVEDMIAEGIVETAITDMITHKKVNISHGITKESVKTFLDIDKGIFTPFGTEVDKWIADYINAIGKPLGVSVTYAKDFMEVKVLVNSYEYMREIYESVTKALTGVVGDGLQSGDEVSLPYINQVLLAGNDSITSELNAIASLNMVDIPNRSSLSECIKNSNADIRYVAITGKNFIIKDGQVGILSVMRNDTI